MTRTPKTGTPKTGTPKTGTPKTGTPRTGTPYERAQRRGDEAIRTTLLDAASRLLVAEGPQALSMRRIAHEVGCSTTVLYRMFGGKDGLTEALYLEGFERFRRRLAAVHRDPDPRVHLAALGRAYRDNALLERNYYGLMFDRPIAGFVPSADAQATARASFAILGEAVSACADAGLLTAADPVLVAEMLWATAHGIVSLELAGHLPDADAVFQAAMQVTAGGLLKPPDQTLMQAADQTPAQALMQAAGQTAGQTAEQSPDQTRAAQSPAQPAAP